MSSGKTEPFKSYKELKTTFNSTSNFYDLLDFTVEGKFIIDLKGRCVYVNKAFLDLFKYSDASKLLGKEIHSLIHHSNQNGNKLYKDQCPICKVITNGKKVHLENEIMWKADGSQFPTECWSSPFIVDGKIIGALVSIFDITERKLTEKALKESNIALKEILNRIELEKTEIMLHVQSHVKRVILPIVNDIEKRANKKQVSQLTFLKENLLEITSPFIGELENLYAKLSPREIEICQFVKDGLTSKEIAINLQISQETVRNQRKSIRKKLHIDGKKINLSSFLKTI